MNADLPTSIPAYLERLRRSLDGCDPALAQDALYDAEDYLRSELAANPHKSEAEVIAAVAGSYFGVLVDPHTYGSLFYMLLSLATGTFFFTWVVTGASLSLGLAILIIGIPFFILFVGATRILSLVEGRIVEVMLGERMPRRPLYSDRTQPWLERIQAMFTDVRTWGTMLYFMAMLPLGTIYFSLAVIGLSLSLALIALPFAHWLGFGEYIMVHGFDFFDPYSPWLWPLSIVAGVLLLFATLHLARFIGRIHGRIAKQLLVSSQAY